MKRSEMDGVIGKGFLVQPSWCDPEDPEAWIPAWGETASKAKSEARDRLGEDDWFLSRARRAPEFDLFPAMPDPVLSGLPWSAVTKLVHACGCSPEIRDPGYRNHYMAKDESGDLSLLVRAGLMTGPHPGSGSPYWFATPLGMAAALSTRVVQRRHLSRC